MTRSKKVGIGVAVVVVLAAGGYASFRLRPADAVTVNTETIRRRPLQALVSASGKIQAKRSVNISADTMGRVTQLAVEEGDRVKKDQFLLQVDPRNLRSAVQRSEASLMAAESQARQLGLSVESARVALKQAQDTNTRQRDLWKRGLTTRETLENSENDVNMRQSDLRSQEQQIRTQQLHTAEERATTESARFDLSKVRIQSPIDGIVTRRNIEEGETVMIGTMNNAGTVLLTIADMSIVEAEIEVDETDIPAVRLGQKAKVTIDALPNKAFDATVTEIGNSPIEAASASAQATNFKVVLTIQGEVPDVRPGFTCTTEITTDARDNVVAVPIQATTVREMDVDAANNIIRRAQRTSSSQAAGTVQAAELAPGQKRKELEGVFLVKNGKVEFIALKTGIAGDKYFEVVSGISEGDQVVVGPFTAVRELTDGAVVRVEDASAAKPR